MPICTSAPLLGILLCEVVPHVEIIEFNKQAVVDELIGDAFRLDGSTHPRHPFADLIAHGGKRPETVLLLVDEHIHPGTVPFLERHHIQIVADNDPGDASVELPHVDGTVHPAHLVHPNVIKLRNRICRA